MNDKVHVPCALFHTFQAAFIAFVGPRGENAENRRAALDFTVPPKWFTFPSPIAYRRHETDFITGVFLPNASGVSDMDRFFQINDFCRVTIYRSCPEVEPRMLELLTDIFGKPAIPADTPTDLDDGDGARSEVLRWLDEQPPKSVIYVALGSETPVTAENLHELALGLELTGVRFLWAIRKPAGMFSADSAGAGERGLLPDGFEERTRGRGVVRTGWVPQVKALAHGAVGAFLTHCGWGSTIESFMFGYPLVMLPFVVDQPLVARAMAEKGIGVEISRDENDGSFDRDGVATAVRHVMVEEEGKVLASNAKKLQEVLADQKRQELYIDELVEHLRRYRDILV